MARNPRLSRVFTFHVKGFKPLLKKKKIGSFWLPWKRKVRVLLLLHPSPELPGMWPYMAPACLSLGLAVDAQRPLRQGHHLCEERWKPRKLGTALWACDRGGTSEGLPGGGARQYLREWPDYSCPVPQVSARWCGGCGLHEACDGVR